VKHAAGDVLVLRTAELDGEAGALPPAGSTRRATKSEKERRSNWSNAGAKKVGQGGSSSCTVGLQAAAIGDRGALTAARQRRRAIRLQIAKDVELMQTKQIQGSTW